MATSSNIGPIHKADNPQITNIAEPNPFSWIHKIFSQAIDLKPGGKFSRRVLFVLLGFALGGGAAMLFYKDVEKFYSKRINSPLYKSKQIDTYSKYMSHRISNDWYWFKKGGMAEFLINVVYTYGFIPWFLASLFLFLFIPLPRCVRFNRDKQLVYYTKDNKLWLAPWEGLSLRCYRYGDLHQMEVELHHLDENNKLHSKWIRFGAGKDAFGMRHLNDFQMVWSWLYGYMHFQQQPPEKLGRSIGETFAGIWRMPNPQDLDQKALAEVSRIKQLGQWKQLLHPPSESQRVDKIPEHIHGNKTNVVYNKVVEEVEYIDPQTGERKIKRTVYDSNDDQY